MARVINLFSQGYLDDYFSFQLAQISEQIKSTSLEILADPSFLQDKIKQHTINAPTLNFDKVFASSYEKEISASLNPNQFFISRESSYPRQIIVYHIPAAGSLSVLEYQPNPTILWSESVYEENAENGSNICFEVINFTNNAEIVKREFDQFKKNISTQIAYIQKQIADYNSKLESTLASYVLSRKKELDKQNSVLESLGVPVKD